MSAVSAIIISRRPKWVINQGVVNTVSKHQSRLILIEHRITLVGVAYETKPPMMVVDVLLAILFFLFFCQKFVIITIDDDDDEQKPISMTRSKAR